MALSAYGLNGVMPAASYWVRLLSSTFRYSVSAARMPKNTSPA